MLLAVLAGCADHPIAPDVEAAGYAPQTEGVAPSEWEGVLGCGGKTNPCPIPPVNPTVPGPDCDPWLDPSWCQGGPGWECMESIGIPGAPELVGLASCPPGGGPLVPGGPGGGNGGQGGANGLGGLPGDADGDGDTWDDGFGAWFFCVSGVLGSVAGGAATYFAFEDFYYKMDKLREARLRLEYWSNDSPYNHSELIRDLSDRQREMEISRGIAIASAGVTVFAFVGAGALCAPLIFAPTL